MEPEKRTTSYKDLIVWQKSVALAVAVYALTEKFPKEEIYGLTSQMRRAAVSIPSNIAEGRARSTRNDYIHFLRIAHGSVSELETQIEISKQLPFAKNLSYSAAEAILLEVAKMLSVMISKMGLSALKLTSSKA